MDEWRDYSLRLARTIALVACLSMLAAAYYRYTGWPPSWVYVLSAIFGTLCGAMSYGLLTIIEMFKLVKLEDGAEFFDEPEVPAPAVQKHTSPVRDTTVVASATRTGLVSVRPSKLEEFKRMMTDKGCDVSKLKSIAMFVNGFRMAELSGSDVSLTRAAMGEFVEHREYGNFLQALVANGWAISIPGNKYEFTEELYELMKDIYRTSPALQREVTAVTSARVTAVAPV